MGRQSQNGYTSTFLYERIQQLQQQLEELKGTSWKKLEQLKVGTAQLKEW